MHVQQQIFDKHEEDHEANDQKHQVFFAENCERLAARDLWLPCLIWDNNLLFLVFGDFLLQFHLEGTIQHYLLHLLDLLLLRRLLLILVDELGASPLQEGQHFNVRMAGTDLIFVFNHSLAIL